MSDAMDLLMGSSFPTASFKGAPPITHRGRVSGLSQRQERDIQTGKPKFWENGDPMMQLVVTIETDVIDPEVEGDDGRRNIYAKGNMLKAIRLAVKKSGHRGNIVGGTLAVRYESDGQATKPGFNPPKNFVAKFEPPTETEALDEFADDDLDDYGEEPF